MLKKIMLLAVSAGALAAFAAPAAQAQQLYELNQFGGHDQLKNGAKVTATAPDLTTHTPFGTLSCTLVTIHGEVTENKPNSVKIANNSVTVEGCNTLITDPTVGTITIVKEETVGVAHDATFVADLSPELSCHFTGDIPFSYAHDTDTLTVTGANQLTGTPNPPCGTGTMTGGFTLETSNGTAVLME